MKENASLHEAIDTTLAIFTGLLAATVSFAGALTAADGMGLPAPEIAVGLLVGISLGSIASMLIRQ